MGLSFRKSFKIGPLLVTLSRRGIGASFGLGPLRIGRSAGRRTTRLKLPGGFSWRKSGG